MKRVKWAAAAAAAGAALLFVVALMEVMVLLLPAASGAHVYGTSDADTIVYGRIYKWAVPEGGGGFTWIYEYEEGGCVFEYSDTSPFRGDYLYHQEHEYGDGWAVYGMMGEDMIYSPSLYDAGSLVCGTSPTWVKVETDTVNEYRTRIYGDTGSTSTGDDDKIYGCPSWPCYLYGNGGADFILGGTDDDYIYGHDGADDYLDGDEGDDYINGGDGNDIVYGWIGNDTLAGEGDSDTLYGESGNDTIYGGTTGSDSDYCSGGPGTDTCSTFWPYDCETEYCENP